MPHLPVDSRAQETTRRALAERPRITRLISDLLSRGIDEVHLIGCGGSLNNLGLSAHVLQSRSTRFPVTVRNSHEFLLAPPPRLGPASVVIAASHNGTTFETVEAAASARAAGAHVIAVTKDAATPLAKTSDHAFTYDSARTITAPVQILLMQLAYALLEQSDVAADYPGLYAALDALPEALAVATEEADLFLPAIADALANSPHTYVLAGGGNFATAYGTAMCYLMEMQRLPASAYNANEFFHGAFEIVADGTTVLLWRAEDTSAVQIDRLGAFLARVDADAHVIDSRALSLPGIPAHLRAHASSIALIVLSRRLAEHIESRTGHPLTTRRYMFAMDY